MANVVNWFEIPVSDFNRAKEFYTEVLGGELHIEEVMGTKMGFFNMEGDGVGGAICHGEGYKPSAEAAGGKITLPKTKISDEIGFMAFFFDTEGNKLAFHSQA